MNVNGIKITTQQVLIGAILLLSVVLGVLSVVFLQRQQARKQAPQAPQIQPTTAPRLSGVAPTRPVAQGGILPEDPGMVRMSEITRIPPANRPSPTIRKSSAPLQPPPGTEQRLANPSPLPSAQVQLAPVTVRYENSSLSQNPIQARRMQPIILSNSSATPVSVDSQDILLQNNQRSIPAGGDIVFSIPMDGTYILVVGGQSVNVTVAL